MPGTASGDESGTDGTPDLTDFQLEVARLFFSLPASKGFLLAGGAALDLLGQDELQTSTLEAAFKEQIAQRASEGVWSEKQTEQIILAAAGSGSIA